MTDIDGLASEAHSIAESLARIETGQKNSRTLTIALTVAVAIGTILLIINIFLVRPIYRTANTVERVTGPAAQKAQARATVAILAQLGATVDCSQRANLSEALKTLDLPVLAHKDGCPPYAFGP